MKVKFTILIMALIIFLSFPLPAVASSESTEITILNEIDLPADLDFSINDTCSEHAYFKQATANENGMFAVYSWHHNPNDRSDFSFTKAYIDIYHADGSFYQELSFTSSVSFVIELTAETVNIYFYSSVLIYELKSQELHYYEVLKDEAANRKLHNELDRASFSCGNWNYKCKKSYMGYTKLIRTNQKEEQILIEMPGVMNILWEVTLPGIICGLLVVILVTGAVAIWVVCLWKKRN